MGLITCKTCGEDMGLSVVAVQAHVCDPNRIRSYVNALKVRTEIAERNLDLMQNAVYRLLEPLHPDEFQDGPTIMVETDWLRKLWDATLCVWYGADTADSFLSRWLCLHMILSASFSLFKKDDNPFRTKLEKFRHLCEVCQRADGRFGYESNFDVTPEELSGKE